jgi:hypothetical protein
MQEADLSIYFTFIAAVVQIASVRIRTGKRYGGMIFFCYKTLRYKFFSD